MRRHKFEVFDGASGFVCTAMVMRDDGGDQCGRYADDPIHEPRYDPYGEFWLRPRPEQGQDDEYDLPVLAHLCNDCGGVAVDIAVHDRFHAELSDPPTRMST